MSRRGALSCAPTEPTCSSLVTLCWSCLFNCCFRPVDSESIRARSRRTCSCHIPSAQHGVWFSAPIEMGFQGSLFLLWPEYLHPLNSYAENLIPSVMVFWTQGFGEVGTS